ncbi:MAG: hypothetical protein MZU95_09710 [Desulfomicrobium escambiense]|nr:hypothetical protein [Desulfomicrobium escambiense]
MDSLWGAGIGGLVGGATLAFMDHPGDHCERIYQGAAIGCHLRGWLRPLRDPAHVLVLHHPIGQKERVYGLNLSIPLK